MGNFLSGNDLRITEPLIQDIIKNTSFTKQEVTRLWDRFIQLDKDKDGFLTADELINISEMKENRMRNRIVCLMLSSPRGPARNSCSMNESDLLSSDARKMTGGRVYKLSSVEPDLPDINEHIDMNPNAEYSEESMENSANQHLAEKSIPRSHKVNFYQYCHFLNNFSNISNFNNEAENEKASELKRLKVLFKVYDVDNDGLITKKDLLNILTTLLCEIEELDDRDCHSPYNPSEDPSLQVCYRMMNKIFKDSAENKNGINFDNFCRISKGINVNSKMSIDKRI